METKAFAVKDLRATDANKIAPWFATIKKDSLPKANSAVLGRLLEEAATKDANWMAEFIKIEALKDLLLLQDSNQNTVLHYLANTVPVDNTRLLAVLNLLDFALPTLRPLRNAAGKTAFHLYTEKKPNRQDATVKDMLDPAQPTSAAEPISPEQLTALAGALSILNSSIDSDDDAELFFRGFQDFF